MMGIQRPNISHSKNLSFMTHLLSLKVTDRYELVLATKLSSSDRTWTISEPKFYEVSFEVATNSFSLQLKNLVKKQAFSVISSPGNFGPRSRLTECWSLSGSKPFDTLIVRTRKNF